MNQALTRRMALMTTISVDTLTVRPNLAKISASTMQKPEILPMMSLLGIRK